MRAAGNKTFILLGNPGTGKSTLLNGRIGSAQFKSGASIGTGLTAELQIYVDHAGGVNYLDPPGLHDDKEKQAVQEIDKAFKDGAISKSASSSS